MDKKENNTRPLYDIPKLVTGRMYIIKLPQGVKFNNEVNSHYNCYGVYQTLDLTMRDKKNLPNFIKIDDDDCIIIGPALLSFAPSQEIDPETGKVIGFNRLLSSCFILPCKSNEMRYISFYIPQDISYSYHKRDCPFMENISICRSFNRQYYGSNYNQNLQAMTIALKNPKSLIKITRLSRRSKLYKEFEKIYLENKFIPLSHRARRELLVIGKDRLQKNPKISDYGGCPCTKVTRSKEAMCANI